MVVPESINNIMGGLESTGGVTLHNHRRKLKQRFETISKLGQGTYGKVQLGVNKETGQEVAIKTIKKCKIETEADLIRIRREIQIMSSLRHPYIIHIYEVFENRDKMVLVMEYAAGGELYDYLTKQKVLDETEARRIFRQIAMAVFYCHKHQICHRDLKLENILLDEQGNAKIADFGLSNVFESSRLLSTFCGSPLYASPEIVLGIPYHGPEVDCWSLGVLLYTLVYGAMPFDGSNFKRLVRQISAGDYFEPKVPSSASDLIHGLLTVSKDERLNITAVCQHAWMNEEGIVSCHRLAVELAQEEPNRLDLLLALAPSNEQVPSVPEESATVPTAPVRSQSLSSLGCVQPSATFTAVTGDTQPPSEEKKKADSEKRRERSRSRSRKMDGDEGKTRKRSTKSKKKSDSELPPKEEVEKVLELAAKVNQNLSAEDSSPSSLTEPVSFESSVELPPSCESNTEASPMKSTESESTPLEIQLTTETSDVVEEVKSETSTAPTFSEEPLQPQLPPPEVIDEAPVSVKKEKKPEVTIATEKSSTKIKSPSTKSVSTLPNQTEGADVKRQPQIKARRSVDKIPSNNKEAPVLRQDSVRRKSKVFETAELFSKSPSTDKAGTKKVVIPGVKVSDAKAAFERRSSLSQSPTTDKKPDFSLASTVGLNKLVMNELNKEKQIDIDANEVPSPAPREIVKETEEEKTKKENAVKVISHAISESEMNVKKASTLPRRKLSRSSISNQEEPVPVPVSPVSSPSAPKVVPPVPAPRPYVVRKASGPREHIIPIKIEERTVPNQPERSERAQSERPRPSSRQASISSSVASSSSFGRQDSDSSTLLGSTISPSEPIRKSPREVIIPIAVEGGGYVTPSQSTLSKMSSVSESEEDLPMRGFGLHSTRRRHPQLETADSVSSDEDDGDFEAISTENLFQTLLARMRNLTQRLDEGRPTFPRMFSPMFEPRRLMETKSFDMEPSWRRKSGITSTSSSTLPRGFTAKSLRRALSRDEPKTDTTDLPPTPQRKVTRTTSDSLHNGFHSGRRYGTSRRQESSENETATTALDHLLKNGRLSSLERVKKYLEDIQNEGINNEEAPKMRETSERLSTKYWRPRSVYIPEMIETSEFDKYMDFKHSLNSFSGFNTNRRASNAYDRIKELHEYRRSVSEMAKSCQNENEKLEMDNETVPEKKKEEILPVETDDAPVNKSTILNKYLDEQQKPKKESRFLSKVRNSKKEESRVDKTIKALRHRSVGIENEFSESKLLKRAVSLEDLSSESVDGRTRASSLTPESAFERRNSSVKLKKGGIFDQIRQSATTTTTADDEGRRKEKEERFTRISNLKKFDNFPKLDQLSTESTPTGDFDEAQSCLSQTDNSDTWSGSDYNERYFDAGAPTSTTGEDNVGERIRRKSFFHRFNAPKRYSYQRSASNVEKKRYF